MKSLKSISLYTHIYKFWDSQWQKNYSLWLNVVPSLRKLSQAVLVRSEQTNLQSILNKGTGVQVSQFLSMIVRKFLKRFLLNYDGIIWRCVLVSG